MFSDFIALQAKIYPVASSKFPSLNLKEALFKVIVPLPPANSLKNTYLTLFPCLHLYCLVLYSHACTPTALYFIPMLTPLLPCTFIGVGRGGEGGAGGARPPPNNFGGGANIPFGPSNNPPAFSFNFYVKQEKITNVPS